MPNNQNTENRLPIPMKRYAEIAEKALPELLSLRSDDKSDFIKAVQAVLHVQEELDYYHFEIGTEEETDAVAGIAFDITHGKPDEGLDTYTAYVREKSAREVIENSANIFESAGDCINFAAVLEKDDLTDSQRRTISRAFATTAELFSEDIAGFILTLRRLKDQMTSSAADLPTSSQE